MTEDFFEQLLNEEEGPALDFKREQYRFTGADDATKAELLKDILAFANAWRRTTAYILIGVDEVRGGRSIPLGVSDHLDDANLQQFVSSKTNAPVTFRYVAYTFRGTSVGIIEVPVQERPRFLNRSFGGLSPSTVYIRRSSSTDIADPAEIARIGRAGAQNAAGLETDFDVQWMDPESKRPLGALAKLDPLVLTPMLALEDVIPQRSHDPLFRTFDLRSEPTERYYGDRIGYTFTNALLGGLSIAVRNTGINPGLRVRIVLSLPATKARMVFSDDDRPHPPPRDPSDYALYIRGAHQAPCNPSVHRIESTWEVHLEVGDLQPGAIFRSPDPLHIGGLESEVVEVHIRILANNLAAPIERTLGVEFQATTRPMTFQDYLDSVERE